MQLTFLPTCYQAIEDLTKALEFEPNSADILHERGNLHQSRSGYQASSYSLLHPLKTILCLANSLENNYYNYLRLSASFSFWS